MKRLPAPPPGLLDGAALFLDFDGTLVDLADAPDLIRIDESLPDLLRHLHRRLDGRLAIVSGRAIADLERHIDCAGMAIAGSHGLELRLPDGSLLPLFVPPGLEDVRSQIDDFVQGDEGLLVEQKPAGLALHYRRSPAREAEAVSMMERLARRHGLALQQGKMVAELRAPGADKGDAVRAFMAEPGFAGARPVVVGDDLTDEHAFEAAAALGGSGILVGPERETAARYRLGGVEAVAGWLRSGG